MKIAIRGGHSLDIRGASGVVDEVTEDRKITAKVVEYLKLLGHDVLDVTPGNSGSSAVDLSVAANKANAWGAEYFASIHLNAGGGHGVEVLYRSAKGKEFADKIVQEIAELGFTNRGSKADVRGLYEFAHVKAPNNIVECFFCDSQADVDLYNKVGIDVIAKAIVKGITGQDIINKEVSSMLPKGFNEEYYLWKYKDVAEAVKSGQFSSGADHYEKFGKNENREYKLTLPLEFTEGAYLTNNPDVAAAVADCTFVSGATHYLQFGYKEDSRKGTWKAPSVNPDIKKQIIDLLGRL